MSSRRQRSIPLGGRYRQVSLFQIMLHISFQLYTLSSYSSYPGIQLCITGNMFYLWYSYKPTPIPHQLLKYLTFNVARGQIDYIIRLAQVFCFVLKLINNADICKHSKRICHVGIREKMIENEQLSNGWFDLTTYGVFFFTLPPRNKWFCVFKVSNANLILCSFGFRRHFRFRSACSLFICLPYNFTPFLHPIRISQCCWAATCL